MTGKLSGQVAFVTGGSKGIGRAISIGLAEAGATVALTGRNAGTGPGTAHETVAQIEATGGKALALTCDVRDADSVRAAIDTTVATCGRLDILMNNAGLFFPGSDVIDVDLGQWLETIETHINGTFYAARFAAQHMIAGGGGSIINMSSTGGDPSHDTTGNVAYGVAKAGIEQFTRGLARELASANIAVNAIRPMALLSEGSMNSADWLTRYRAKSGGRAMHDDITDEERLKKFSPPSAIVPSIVYLAQQRAGFTGKIVRRTDFADGSFQALVWPAST
jgi:3-oxoacyl-[acyl-carrier protein] reductase